jgi:hypothetical protein
MSKVVGVRLNLILGLWWVSISSVAYDFFFSSSSMCVFFSGLFEHVLRHNIMELLYIHLFPG